MVACLVLGQPALAADNVRPTIGLPSPDNAVAGVAVNIHASAIDDSSGIASCRLYVDNLDVSAMQVISGQAEVMYTFLAAGVHTIFVFCRDNANNFNSGASGSVLVTAPAGGSSLPPTIEAITATSAFVNVPITLSANVSGAASCTLLANSFPVGEMTIAAGVATRQHTFINAGSQVMSMQCVSTGGVSTIGPSTIVVVGLSPVPPVAVPQGQLIKTSCPTGAAADHPCKAVYYRGVDGKRHAFPNSRVFFTWYTDFLTVKEVSATEMAASLLGRQVTYRPGVKLVKFTTLNNVYAVARGGVLRWIKTEAAAAALYGVDWNKKIDDISDVFFLDYTFGVDINTAADFSPAAEMAASPTIE